MSLARSLLLFLAPLLLLSGPAKAYNLGSGVTHPCHEELTIGSGQVLMEEVARQGLPIPLPADDLWQRVATEVFSVLPPEDDPGPENPEARFLTLSLLLGVRHPDTVGHSVGSIIALRRSHSDPTPESQYQHCLRSAGDDGPSADQEVLEAARLLLASRLNAAATAFLAPTDTQLQAYPVYLEFSGQTQVELYWPAFLLGEALHVVQDSFAHTIRTDDGGEVLAVLNFVEAADGSLDETRDGLAHSKALDRCEDEALGDLAALAGEISLAATSATIAQIRGDTGPLQKGLAPCRSDAGVDPTCGWMSYPLSCTNALTQSGSLKGTCCSAEEGYCQTRWLPIARTSPTRSLSQDVFGCTWTAPVGRRPTLPSVLLYALLWCVLGARRRWRNHCLGALVCAAGLQPTTAGAQAQAQSATRAQKGGDTSPPGSTSPPEPMGIYGAMEVHGSLASGQAERGLPDVTFGPHLRVGIRPQKARPLSVGYFALIEQSSWLATETATFVKPGVLNLGVGAELMYFDVLRGSLACGPSLLLSDTVAHAAPHVGMFVDLRPVGLRLPLSRWFLITLDPLTATWVAPALSAPMVATLHYRIVIGLEWLPH